MLRTPGGAITVCADIWFFCHGTGLVVAFYRKQVLAALAIRRCFFMHQPRFGFEWRLNIDASVWMIHKLRTSRVHASNAFQKSLRILCTTLSTLSCCFVACSWGRLVMDLPPSALRICVNRITSPLCRRYTQVFPQTSFFVAFKPFVQFVLCCADK